MFNDHVLSESSAMTGIKCALLMLAFMLLAYPVLQLSVGSQVDVIGDRLKWLSTNAVNQQQDHNTLPEAGVPPVTAHRLGTTIY